MHFRATQVLSSLDGGSNLPLLASLKSKCADTSDGTASALAIFVCLYQQNLFWYQQDPYIPTGAKLYLQNPKGTHTVVTVSDLDRQEWQVRQCSLRLGPWVACHIEVATTTWHKNKTQNLVTVKIPNYIKTYNIHHPINWSIISC